MSYKSAYLEIELDFKNNKKKMSLALHPLSFIKDAMFAMIEAPTVVKHLDPQRSEVISLDDIRHSLL